MFKALDKDGSGAIDAVELSSSIRAVFGNQLSKQVGAVKDHKLQCSHVHHVLRC